MVSLNRRALLRQSVAALIGQLGVIVCGTSFVWFEPLTVKLVQEGVDGLQMTAEELSLIVASIELSALVFNVPVGYLSKWFGRKLVCWLIGPLSIVSLLIVLCTRSVTALYIVRIIDGLNVAITFNVCITYTAEIAGPAIRGTLTSMFQSLFYLGCLYSYCFGPYLPYNWYAAVCIPLPLLYTVSFLFIPESPYWYIKQGRSSDARKSLSWLRATTDVTEEFDSMQKAVEEELESTSENPWKALIVNSYERKAFIALQVIAFAKILSGIPVLIIYSSEMFSTTFNFLGSSEMTIVFGVMLVVFPLVPAALSDRLGRKYLLIVSCFGTVVCHFMSGLYFYLSEEVDSSTLDAKNFVWMLYIGIIGYCFFLGCGYGTLFQTLQSEVFGAKTREIGSAITQVIIALYSFAIIYLFQIINTNIGVFLNFWAYSFCNLLSGIYFVKYMFETAGKPIGRSTRDA